MDLSVFYYALILVAKVGGPVLAAVVVGGLIGGLIQSALKMEDVILSVIGKIVGAVLAIYLSAGFISSAFVDFTTRVWGGPDMYR